MGFRDHSRSDQLTRGQRQEQQNSAGSDASFPFPLTRRRQGFRLHSFSFRGRPVAAGRPIPPYRPFADRRTGKRKERSADVYSLHVPHRDHLRRRQPPRLPQGRGAGPGRVDAARPAAGARRRGGSRQAHEKHLGRLALAGRRAHPRRNLRPQDVRPGRVSQHRRRGEDQRRRRSNWAASSRRWRSMPTRWRSSVPSRTATPATAAARTG